jgi:hypothetical protein
VRWIRFTVRSAQEEEKSSGSLLMEAALEHDPAML